MEGDRVLVAHGSKRGSTAEIPEWIGDALRERGLDTDVRRASKVRDVDAVRRVGARGHTTFGGRLTEDSPGFIARAMAKNVGGDYRNPTRVRAWALEIADSLRGITTTS